MDTIAGKSSVNVLACILSHVVSKYDREGRIGVITKFHTQHPPSMSIPDYMERIRIYSECSIESFIHALIYIDRLIKNTNITVNSYNVHRIVITAVMIAAKYFDDFYYSNQHYAKIGGINLNEMNSLELTFLTSVHFSLYVSPNEFLSYYNELFFHSTRCSCVSKNECALPRIYNMSSEISQFALLTYTPIPPVIIPHYVIPCQNSQDILRPYCNQYIAVVQNHYV
ncbi:hypothetical protein WA158_000607 [Blastocystis sp. Blastoise]